MFYFLSFFLHAVVTFYWCSTSVIVCTVLTHEHEYDLVYVTDSLPVDACFCTLGVIAFLPDISTQSVHAHGSTDLCKDKAHFVFFPIK